MSAESDGGQEVRRSRLIVYARRMLFRRLKMQLPEEPIPQPPPAPKSPSRWLVFLAVLAVLLAVGWAVEPVLTALPPKHSQRSCLSTNDFRPGALPKSLQCP